jgi:hypothetical protein
VAFACVVEVAHGSIALLEYIVDHGAGVAGVAGAGKAARTASARVLIRGGADEKTGEALTAAMVTQRVSWCASIVSGMTARLVAGRWNAADVAALASGAGPDGRPLPSRAWMALRRLGWDTAPPEGITVNDRVARMAQEQAGRLLRSAAWRAGLTAAVVAAWPGGPGQADSRRVGCRPGRYPRRRACPFRHHQGQDPAGPAAPGRQWPAPRGRVRPGVTAARCGDAAPRGVRPPARHHRTA